MRFVAIVIAASFAGSVLAQTENLPVGAGKFKPTDASLKQYKYPEWFRDAKFGIWSHWGPQALPGNSDWYAREMYQSDYYDCEKDVYKKANPANTYHQKHYGHPSEVGFKDILPLWKAEKWNPEELMKLYKRVGARYFVSMGVHHDNFSLWNTRLNRWNSVNMGPKKDIVGLWQQAAKKEGLYFGVSEHLGASYTWFQPSHKSDQLGDKAGVPYDANNPEYWDLYHEPAQAGDNGWLTNNPKWQRDWYDRILELIDNYHPDLLYSDSELPFGDVGRSMVAHYYNSALKYNKGGVVYNCKLIPSEGRWVRDIERGASEGISEDPWQTDTSIADWFYTPGVKYRSASEIIQMLIDIVSKNGNLLLNVVQTPEGDLDKEVWQVLEDIARWMADNGEAIYGTRPWVVYGEGPSVVAAQEKGPFGGLKDVRDYKQGDLRFTAKGKTIYAFCLEKPESDIHISSLGLKTATGRKIKSISLLGSAEKLKWTQNDEEVVVRKPLQLPGYNTVVFLVNL
jgi:alpha-L-fucosidase